MRFEVKEREKKNTSLYLNEDLEIARKFAKLMYKEFGSFISAMVLFGSATKNVPDPKKDIDVLIVLDDVRIQFSRELIETYRILAQRAIAATEPQRLHIQSMKLTSFWEYVRAGDPVAINILRSGVALIDTGFFDPLQALLDQGRIRPSAEAVWTYFTMAPASLHSAEQHLLTAAVDLYWGGIDAVHAALMMAGETPPTPSHAGELLDRVLIREGFVSKKAGSMMNELYDLFKGITHRDIQSISGEDYEKYKRKAQMLIDEMKEFIEIKQREKEREKKK